MIDKMSNASRLVEKLRVKGLVERHECPLDRRRVDVLITQKGLDLIERASQAVDVQGDAYMSGLTLEEAALLNSLLDKLRG
jgi:DNA-binding MarR family transcriptional regulator